MLAPPGKPLSEEVRGALHEIAALTAEDPKMRAGVISLLRQSKDPDTGRVLLDLARTELRSPTRSTIVIQSCLYGASETRPDAYQDEEFLGLHREFAALLDGASEDGLLRSNLALSLVGRPKYEKAQRLAEELAADPSLPRMSIETIHAMGSIYLDDRDLLSRRVRFLSGLSPSATGDRRVATLSSLYALARNAQSIGTFDTVADSLRAGVAPIRAAIEKGQATEKEIELYRKFGELGIR
jgi:hypothetical protein